MLTLVYIVVAVCVLGAILAAGGGFDSRRRTRRRSRVVERPARRVVGEPAPCVVEERRIVE